MFRIFHPEVMVFLIPISAIVGHYIYKIAKLRCEHEERIARIEAGLDPDFELEEELA